MRIHKSVVFLFLFCMNLCAFAAAKETFVLGQDYAPVVSSERGGSNVSAGINVVEFFSYGCPWCYSLEPSLEKWLKKQPASVHFSRVPVTFEQGWSEYAKAFYVAQFLKIEPRMTPLLFDAIQKENRSLSTDESMALFFIHEGVDPNVAHAAFESSPTLDRLLQESVARMKENQVMVIPAVVVSGRNGKYTTNIQMANADNDRFIAILDYLVKQAAL